METATTQNATDRIAVTPGAPLALHRRHDTELQKSVEILNLCIDSIRGECRQVHRWLFTADMIRSYRLARYDEQG
ncbi:unnamed protein product [Plutella xylostella]|uniref:(diamondback moth) hypothetical protein n=1 Tax=Plutella xylostella TaxID=51655 RepID=A0A8S4EVT7_PLUXY|nr:unnamed protein product [Plutella xylostella]